MSEESRIYVEEEYGAQLHRFYPHKVYENVTATMKEIIDEGVDGLLKQLNSKSPGCDCESVASLLKTEFYASIERGGPQVLDAIKAALQISPDFVLPEDNVQRRQYTSEEIDKIHQRTKETERKILYNNQLQRALLAELQIVDSLDVMETNVAEWQQLCHKNRSESGKIEKAVNLMHHENGFLYRVPQKTLILSCDNVIAKQNKR